MSTKEVQRGAKILADHRQSALVSSAERVPSEGVPEGKDRFSLGRLFKPGGKIIIASLISAALCWLLSGYLLDKLAPNPPSGNPSPGAVMEYARSVANLAYWLRAALSVLAGLLFALFGPLWTQYRERGAAFDYIWKAEGARQLDKGIRKPLLRHLKEKWDQHVIELITLCGEHQLASIYPGQLNFAEIFSHFASKRFWATSLDLPSELLIRNEAYFHSMDEMNIRGEENGIPRKCRVFVAPLKDLIKDIASKSVIVTDLFEWHLKWHPDTEDHAERREHDPIRFLVCREDYSDYLELFAPDGHKLEEEETIPDFMIVDDKFVYGRRTLRVGHDRSVNLGYFPKAQNMAKGSLETLTAYCRIFETIWHKADELDDLKVKIEKDDSQRIVSQAIDELIKDGADGKSVLADDHDLLTQIRQQRQAEIRAFFEHNHNLREVFRNAREVDQVYGDYFRGAKDGELFYKRVKDRIAVATNKVVAVDRADKKEEGQRFYQAWETQEEYLGFFEASKTAAASRCTVERIFIIEGSIPKSDTADFIHFIDKFLDAHMPIGVIINREEVLAEINNAFDSDFIITDVLYEASPGEMFKRSFGFEMKDKEFKMNRLSYDDNLVAPRRFGFLYNIHYALWRHKDCVHFESRRDFDQVPRLLSKGAQDES